MINIFYGIIKMSISASWLIAAVIVLRFFLRKAPRRIVCFLWALAAIRLVCPFAIESRFSLIPETPGSFLTYEGQVNGGNEADDVNGGSETDSVNGQIYNAGANDGDFLYGEDAGNFAGNNAETSVGDTVNVPENVKNDLTEKPAISMPDNSKADNFTSDNFTAGNVNRHDSAKRMNGEKIAAAIWLLGAAILLSYAVFSYVLLRRRTRVSINSGDNIYICDDIDTPFILGVFLPKIYIPSLLTVEERGYVIAHERAHLKRLDNIRKPFGYILVAVHWFNPLVWAAYMLMCRDIEIACDEKVVSDKSIEYKKQYAMTLLSCSSQRKMVSACPLAFGEVGVKTRIRKVLNYRKPAFWLVIIAIVTCIVVSVCFMTNPKSDGKKFEKNIFKLLIGGSMQGDNNENSTDNLQTDDGREYPGSPSEVLESDGWRVWIDALEGYSYVNNDNSIDIKNDTHEGNAYIQAYKLPQALGTYDELKESDSPGKWGMALAGTLEEYIDGEVGVSIYKYYEMISPLEREEPGAGYYIVFGSSESDTVWTMMLPVGWTREEADEFIKAVHLELDSTEKLDYIDYEGWHIEYQTQDGWEGSFSGNELKITDTEGTRSVSLVPYDETENSRSYDTRKESYELYVWRIEGLGSGSGYLSSYTESNGNVAQSIYSLTDSKDMWGDFGYVVIYSAAQSDIIWYIRFPEGYTDDIYTILRGISVRCPEAEAAMGGKLKYYDKALPLSVYEQYERAEDEIKFLAMSVPDEDGNGISYDDGWLSVFDLLADELKTENPDFYEKLKNPANSAQALLRLNYTSYLIYNDINAGEVSKVVEFTFADGSKRAIKMRNYDERGLWCPDYEYDIDSDTYQKIIFVNECMDALTSKRLKDTTEVYQSGKVYDLADDYVILSSVPDSDIVLYGLYGGNAMVLRDGENVLPIWLGWMSPQMWIPELYSGDYDDDGVMEYALKTHMKTGTGVSGDELYFIETDWNTGADGRIERTINEFKEGEWIRELGGIDASFDAGSNILTVTLDGEAVTQMDISALLEMYSAQYSGIGFGNQNSFTQEDGQWYFSASSGIFVEKSAMPRNECKIIANAKVVYTPDGRFHLEDVTVSVDNLPE